MRFQNKNNKKAGCSWTLPWTKQCCGSTETVNSYSIGCLAKRWTRGRSCSCDISRPQTREIRWSRRSKRRKMVALALFLSRAAKTKTKQKLNKSRLLMNTSLDPGMFKQHWNFGLLVALLNAWRNGVHMGEAVRATSRGRRRERQRSRKRRRRRRRRRKVMASVEMHLFLVARCQNKNKSTLLLNTSLGPAVLWKR